MEAALDVEVDWTYADGGASSDLHDACYAFFLGNAGSPLLIRADHVGVSTSAGLPQRELRAPTLLSGSAVLASVMNTESVNGPVHLVIAVDDLDRWVKDGRGSLAAVVESDEPFTVREAGSGEADCRTKFEDFDAGAWTATPASTKVEALSATADASPASVSWLLGASDGTYRAALSGPSASWNADGDDGGFNHVAAGPAGAWTSLVDLEGRTQGWATHFTFGIPEGAVQHIQAAIDRAGRPSG